MKTTNHIASATESSTAAGTKTPATPRVFGAIRETQRFSVEWAAGFLDGEGCIHIARQTYQNKRRCTYVLRVYIVQNNREVLEHFRDGVGIDARIYKVRRLTAHNKQVYTLNYQGKKAMALIGMLTPHLVRKREEAHVALTYWVEGRVGFRPGPKGLPPELVATRERLYLKMRSLK